MSEIGQTKAVQQEESMRLTHIRTNNRQTHKLTMKHTHIHTYTYIETNIHTSRKGERNITWCLYGNTEQTNKKKIHTTHNFTRENRLSDRQTKNKKL